MKHSRTGPSSTLAGRGGTAAHDDDTRQRLLAAAGPVFAAAGFGKATVREICRVAGVNVASIGYHFGDKMGLYLEVVRQVRAKREQAFPLPQDDHLEPAERLRQRVRLVLTRVMSCPGDDHWETQLMMREMQSPTIAFEEIVRDYFQPLFEQLTSILRALSPHDTPIAALHRLALGVVGQCLYYRIGAKVIRQLIPPAEVRDELGLETLSDHITAVTLAAVQSPLTYQVTAKPDSDDRLNSG